MEFKKSIEIYILPIIFIILFITAIVVGAIYLKESDIAVIIMFVSVPGVMLVGMILYLIYLIIIPRIILKVDSKELSTKKLVIPLKDINHLAVRRGVLSTYHPHIVISLKDGNLVVVRNLANPYDAARIINKEYLHIKGNWER